MLVSAYFSFGWTHAGAEEHDWIRKKTPDEYALCWKEELRRRFDAVFDVLSAHDPVKGYHVHLVSYEQMVYAFSNWIADLVHAFDFSHQKAEAIATEALWTKFSGSFSAEVLSNMNESASHTRAVLPGRTRVCQTYCIGAGSGRKYRF
jgi:hypothetical protein